MEKDDELKGIGNSYDFGNRSIYDPRVARFISVDIRSSSFPSFSPYSYANNKPLTHVDFEGEFAQLIIKYGVDVAINIATQMLMAYMFDENVNSFADAWESTSLIEAFGEGIVDAVGTKKAKMAINSMTSLFSHIDKVGIDKVTGKSAVIAMGIGLMEPIIGDAISKYGIKVVAKGMKKLNLDQATMNNLMGGVFLSKKDYKNLMIDPAKGVRDEVEIKQVMAAIDKGSFGIKGSKIQNPSSEYGADFIVDGIEIDVKKLDISFLDQSKDGLKRVGKIVNKTLNNGQYVIFDTKGMKSDVINKVKTRLKDAGADMNKIDFIDSSKIGKINTF